MKTILMIACVMIAVSAAGQTTQPVAAGKYPNAKEINAAIANTVGERYAGEIVVAPAVFIYTVEAGSFNVPDGTDKTNWIVIGLEDQEGRSYPTVIASKSDFANHILSLKRGDKIEVYGRIGKVDSSDTFTIVCVGIDDGWEGSKLREARKNYMQSDAYKKLQDRVRIASENLNNAEAHYREAFRTSKECADMQSAADEAFAKKESLRGQEKLDAAAEWNKLRAKIAAKERVWIWDGVEKCRKELVAAQKAASEAVPSTAPSR